MTKLILGLIISLSSIPSIHQQRNPGTLIIGGVRAPEVLSETKPTFTMDAIGRRIEGAVVLEGFVRKDGRFELYRIVRGLGFGLDEQAAIAVRSWLFRPGTKDGIAVDMLHTVEVLFRRADAKAQLSLPVIGNWMKQFVEEAKQAGLEGWIDADFTISPTGNLVRVSVVNDGSQPSAGLPTAGAELIQHFMDAARQAKVTPARIRGTPVESNSHVQLNVKP